MVKRIPIPSPTKKQLLKEAGNKCANPGCVNRLIEFHHIQNWSVYQTHNQLHMIVICPACHDTVTRGSLKIDDQTLYRWKNISRKSFNSDNIFVEPGTPVRILLGSITVMTPNQIIVFDLPNKNRLVLKVIDEDILSLDASICLSNEENIFKMTNNVIKYKKNDGIEVRRRTGKFQLILSGEALKMIPNWIINQHLLSGSDYFATSEYKLIDIEVIEPGLVKIQGIWMDQETAIVVSPTNLSFINKNAFGTMHLVGKGLQTVILSSAPALFAMAAQYTHKAKS